MGVKTLAVPWDGVEKTAIANPEALKHALADLRATQQAIGRSVKVNGRACTKNRRRLYGKPARQHARVARIRSDYHQTTAQMAKRGGRVTVETLNVDGMKHNRRHARAIGDAGMAGFVRQLEYKCGWHGTAFRRVDRWYPSSTCSRCGAEKQSLLLSERTCRCNLCGFECDRGRERRPEPTGMHGSSGAGPKPERASPSGEVRRRPKATETRRTRVGAHGR